MRALVLVACLAILLPKVCIAEGAPSAATSSAVAPRLGALDPVSVQRGSQVNLSGENLPRLKQVALCGSLDINCEHPDWLDVQESTDKSVKFLVPLSHQPGTYRVRIDPYELDGETHLFANRELVIKRATPAIAALSDSTLYPAGALQDTYSTLQIFGNDFAGNAETNSAEDGAVHPLEKNIIRVNGVRLRECSDLSKSPYCVKSFSRSGDPTTITIDGISRSLVGKVKLDVQVENEVSKSVDLLLSHSPRYAPRVIATVVLGLVLLLSIWASRKKTSAPSGTPTTPTANIPRWKTIFVEFGSNTYSLSRLQLVIWTCVALFGWVYLSVARSLVQATVTFSDIPSGLASVLAVSVGTSITAGGIAAIKGEKSAGPFSPTFSDFFSVGGVIAPERAQFFLWTIVGAVGFIVYTLALDPASIQNLPTLPDGFLQLAGISAVGYVGGKVVRKTGPVLTDVTFDTSTNAWTLTGTGLSASAAFALKTAGNGGGNETRLVGATAAGSPDDQDEDSTLFRKLTITPASTTAGQKSGQNAPTVPNNGFFIIINPDGQRAEWPYHP